jgi:hypothetical protein
MQDTLGRTDLVKIEFGEKVEVKVIPEEAARAVPQGNKANKQA